MVAYALHASSGRKGRPFKAVNCAAIADSLFESEMFGHEKGAYTDAITQRAGVFEQADGGTVFLDEVTKLDLRHQEKLLRGIKDGFERVGGHELLRPDVRIITADSRDLEFALDSGILSEEMYYRLKVCPVSIPPLRERGQDIELLANHFCGRYAEEFGRNVMIPAETMDFFHKYSWPGNVRELEHVIESAIARQRAPLDGDKVPLTVEHVVKTIAHPYESMRRQAGHPSSQNYDGRVYVKPMLLNHLYTTLRQKEGGFRDHKVIKEKLEAHHALMEEVGDRHMVVYVSTDLLPYLFNNTNTEGLYSFQKEIEADPFNKIISNPFLILNLSDLLRTYELDTNNTRMRREFKDAIVDNDIYILSSGNTGFYFALTVQDIDKIVPNRLKDERYDCRTQGIIAQMEQHDRQLRQTRPIFYAGR